MNLEECINTMRSDIVRSVQEIVSIKSVKEKAKPGMPFGEGVNNALLYALDLSSSMGFRTKNLNGYMGYAEYGSGKEIVGILGHLDIIPEGTGWSFPPYDGRIHENKIYGRGTVDNKGPIIAALYGLKAIKEVGLPLNKKIRILFGTDKESGWLDVDHYMQIEKSLDIGFTPDGMFPVSNIEKGVINIEFKKDIIRKSKGMISMKSLYGGETVNTVPGSCTCKLKLKEMAKLMLKDTLELYCQANNINMKIAEEDGMDIIVSTGGSCHSSVPNKGKNAITQLIIFLSQFNLGQNDVSDFIKFLSKYTASQSMGKILNISSSEEISEGVTVNLGHVYIDEEKASASIAIHYPESAKYEDIMESILQATDDKKIEVSVISHKKPLYVSESSELVKILMKSYKDVTLSDAYSVSIGNQTYAKAFNNMVAFGPIFPGSIGSAHMANEHIDIDELIMCTRIYSTAMYELSK